MFTKNELYENQAKINSVKKDYGGNVIVKIENELQSAQEEFVFFEDETVPKNRFITTPEKVWKEEMKAGKVHFEPNGNQEAPKVFKDEEVPKVQQEQPETPEKKKKKFCCWF